MSTYLTFYEIPLEKWGKIQNLINQHKQNQMINDEYNKKNEKDSRFVKIFEKVEKIIKKVGQNTSEYCNFYNSKVDLEQKYIHLRYFCFFLVNHLKGKYYEFFFFLLYYLRKNLRIELRSYKKVSKLWNKIDSLAKKYEKFNISAHIDTDEGRKELDSFLTHDYENDPTFIILERSRISKYEVTSKEAKEKIELIKTQLSKFRMDCISLCINM